MVMPVTTPPEIIAVPVAPVPGSVDVLLINTLGVPNIPTLTKFPAKGFTEADPSVLLERKSVPSLKAAGKLINTASAVAFAGKRHGRKSSKKRQ